METQQNIEELLNEKKYTEELMKIFVRCSSHGISIHFEDGYATLHFEDDLLVVVTSYVYGSFHILEQISDELNYLDVVLEKQIKQRKLKQAALSKLSTEEKEALGL